MNTKTFLLIWIEQLLNWKLKKKLRTERNQKNNELEYTGSKGLKYGKYSFAEGKHPEEFYRGIRNGKLKYDLNEINLESFAEEVVRISLKLDNNTVKVSFFLRYRVRSVALPLPHRTVAFRIWPSFTFTDVVPYRNGEETVRYGNGNATVWQRHGVVEKLKLSLYKS